MINPQEKRKFMAQLRCQLQEYRNSLVLTPLVVAGVLVLFMLVSVAVANKITATGESIMDVLMDEHVGGGMNISITIDEDAPEPGYVVRDEAAGAEADSDEWNFSREWNFNPQRPDKGGQVVADEGSADSADATGRSLNPVLNVLHGLFLLLLLVTSGNYLLATFHHDRRDGSILFWKSLPVSEWQEVATRMATVCLVAPVIYVAVSIVTQLVSAGLAMLVAMRMDMDPTHVVLANVEFISLFRGQLSVMLIWVLWSAPFYAWLLFCSAAARRSPLMFALAIPLGLIILEQLFLGSKYLATAFGNHIPHPGDEGTSQLGFYFDEPAWLSLDYPGMLLGLATTAGLLVGTVWFRKHRFEM